MTKVAELKAQSRARSPLVRFGPDDMVQTQQHPQQQQQHPETQQHLQQQQQQQQAGASPAAWAQAMVASDPRQSLAFPVAAVPVPTAAELAAAQQLPQLLQKLQRTQEKLESRDTSARKYKVLHGRVLTSRAPLQAQVSCQRGFIVAHDMDDQ